MNRALLFPYLLLYYTLYSYSLIKSTLTENKEKIWQNIQKEFKLNVIVVVEVKQKINKMQEIKFNAIYDINSTTRKYKIDLV